MKLGIGTLNDIVKQHSPENKEVIYTEGELSDLHNEIIIECAEMAYAIESSLATATRVIFSLSLEGKDLQSPKTEEELDTIMEAAEGTKENPLKRFWKFVSNIFSKVWDYIKRTYTRFALNAKKLNTALSECKVKLTAAKSKGDFASKSISLPAVNFERIALSIVQLSDRTSISSKGGTANNLVLVNDDLNKALEAGVNSGDFSNIKAKLKEKAVADVLSTGNRAGMVKALVSNVIKEITWSDYTTTAPTTKELVEAYTKRDSETYSGSLLSQLVANILDSMSVVNVMGTVNSVKNKGNSLEKEHLRFKKIYNSTAKELKKDQEKDMKEMATKLSKYYSLTMSAYTTATDYTLALLLEYVRQVKSATEKIS